MRGKIIHYNPNEAKGLVSLVLIATLQFSSLAFAASPKSASLSSKISTAPAIIADVPISKLFNTSFQNEYIGKSVRIQGSFIGAGGCLTDVSSNCITFNLYGDPGTAFISTRKESSDSLFTYRPYIDVIEVVGTVKLTTLDGGIELLFIEAKSFRKIPVK